MAVVDHRQRKGIGRTLVARAIAECRAEGVATLLVATAAADTGNLRSTNGWSSACSESNVTPSRWPMAIPTDSPSTESHFATASG
jgi:GNAT superfamily N-acetyltransferase